jgi:hypothetical protein
MAVKIYAQTVAVKLYRFKKNLHLPNFTPKPYLMLLWLLVACCMHTASISRLHTHAACMPCMLLHFAMT